MLISASNTGVVASSTSSEWLIAVTNPACSSVEKNSVPIPADRLRFGIDVMIAGLEAVDRAGWQP